ncbi:MAG: sulfate adenylyltransferase subunit CysD [Pseudomonadales bacterium]|jgi:sulfate adenylyltransferase subunit 2|nr:sulfate adenylyltransferase subunit CysD [Pseudomonadales bacterium]
MPDLPEANPLDASGRPLPLHTRRLLELWGLEGTDAERRRVERAIESSGALPAPLSPAELHDEEGRAPRQLVVDALSAEARRQRHLVLLLQLREGDEGRGVLLANDARDGRRWIQVDLPLSESDLLTALEAFANDADKDLLCFPHGPLVDTCRRIAERNGDSDLLRFESGHSCRLGLPAFHNVFSIEDLPPKPRRSDAFTHLDRLEAESIHVFREVMAVAERPVMLYSVGKDSSVLLHLARKAFHPAPPPFPLLHIDTRWKFQEMYRFRDAMAALVGMELLVHQNPEAVEKNINPFDHGSALHTDITKTQALKQALDQHGFDFAFGGARRDEEKSRAKERVFSFRTAAHRWDPKNQRPELWDLYNGFKKPGESVRVFPLSNWTERDVWEYIHRENIPIVPLYLARERPVVVRDGFIMMVEDDRLPLLEGERIELRRVRFRTLGCYPLTGAVESDAADLESVILELMRARTSERQGRAIDSDSPASMEKKKQEGYF